MSDFYRRLDEAEQKGRIDRIFKNRPENLHDYQGCANDAMKAVLTKHPDAKIGYSQFNRQNPHFVTTKAGRLSAYFATPMEAWLDASKDTSMPPSEPVKVDYLEVDRLEAERAAGAFIEAVNADHSDRITVSRDIGCLIRNHIETLRRNAK